MRLVDLFSVMAGAALGGGARYALGLAVISRAGNRFPWHTMLVNMAGAFLIGVLMALSLERGVVSPQWRLFIGVGILGGFTTFSALTYETVALFECGSTLHGIANLAGSLLVGCVAVVLGLALGRAL